MDPEMEIFNNLRSLCPENIKYNIAEWESWMIHRVYDMWNIKEINNDQLARLVGEICSF